MASPIIIKSSVTIPGLTKLSRDSVIDSGTLFVYDTVDTYSYAKQAAPVNNDTLVNLVDSGAVATVAQSAVTMGWNGKGIVFGSASNENIVLPVTAKRDGSQGFVWAIWIKHSSTQPATDNNSVGGNAHSTTQVQYNIVYMGSTGLYQIKVNNTIVATVAASGIADGAIVQFGLAYVKTGTSTFVARAYKNGVKIGEVSVSSTLITVTQAGADPGIGKLSSYINTLNFAFYRTWLSDTGTSGSNPDTLIATDYADNSARIV